MTRAQQRTAKPPEPVAVLGRESAVALETLTDRMDLTGLPVFSGWHSYGSDHYLRGPQLIDLREDLHALLGRKGLVDAERQALHDLVGLARRAVDEQLLMVVLPD
jgi:hypothetical protein